MKYRTEVLLNRLCISLGYIRSSRSKMFFKTSVLKKRLQRRCFPENNLKFLRTALFIKKLFLNISDYSQENTCNRTSLKALDRPQGADEESLLTRDVT